MSSFFSSYKHPNWQRLRLEVLSRVNFQCQGCGSEDDTLNAHHNFYLKGRLAWQYEEAQLQSLCDNCHTKAHQTIDQLKAALSYLRVDEVRKILGFTKGLLAERLHFKSVVEKSAGKAILFNNSEEEKEGLLAAFGVRYWEVEADEVLCDVIKNGHFTYPQMVDIANESLETEEVESEG